MEDIQELSAQTTDYEGNSDVGASEIADTSNHNEIEFTNAEDSHESENRAQEEVKKSQKTNSDYARERRKAEQEKALKKARYDAILEALNGENPYTNEKMEDDADVEEYLTMKEMEKKGYDPISDFSKFVKGKAKEKERQRLEENNQKEWIENDKQDFSAKHPDVNLDELVSDELFRTFALGKVGKLSMDKIYTDYQTFMKKSEERATDRAAQVLANTAATPGKLSNQNTTQQKSVENMSKAEFEKMVEKVKRGEIR